MVENLDLAAAVERRKAGRPSRWGPEPDRTKAVSYTHLTLPTILRV